MNRERVGLCFGCFIPMHIGHVSMIERCRNENDRTVIGVCGYDTDRGKDFIPFKERQNLIKRRYEKVSDVTVTIIDDHKIGLTGTFSEDAWAKWIDEFFEGTGYDPNDETKEYTWYTGEESYIEKMQALYPNHKYVLLNRSDIPISGTLIRERPILYGEMIEDTFKQYLYNRINKTLNRELTI